MAILSSSRSLVIKLSSSRSLVKKNSSSRSLVKKNIRSFVLSSKSLVLSSLRLSQILNDQAHGLRREVLGKAGLVAGDERLLQIRTAPYPAVQAVQCHVGIAVGEVQQGKFRLGVAFDGHHDRFVGYCKKVTHFTGENDALCGRK